MQFGDCSTCRNPRERNYAYCNKCHAARQKVYREKNPEHAKAIVRKHHARLKNNMIAAYGGKCACCGEAERDFLTLDHVNGDRRQHMADLGVKACGVFLYRDLRNRDWPQDIYRLLCMNCNWATRLGGMCPHQRSGG